MWDRMMYSVNCSNLSVIGSRAEVRYAYIYQVTAAMSLGQLFILGRKKGYQPRSIHCSFPRSASLLSSDRCYLVAVISFPWPTT
jgi:hypothetical protein